MNTGCESMMYELFKSRCKYKSNPSYYIHDVFFIYLFILSVGASWKLDSVFFFILHITKSHIIETPNVST